jgi:DNA replication protein DnaC
MVITSNRDVDELIGLFPDPLLGNAAMDRLLHHATTMRLTGPSYRRDGGAADA